MQKRRLLLLALVLFALSACTPSPAPTPSDMPKPTSMPTPAPVQLPPYHPDVGFDIASTWTAEFDDSDGRAILELGKNEDGLVPFHVYMYKYGRDSGGDLVSCINDFSAVLSADCSFTGKNNYGDPYTGTLNIVDDTILLTCDWNPEFVYPNRFARVSEPEASTIWYDMPLFPDDIILPLPLSTDHETIVSLLGEPVERRVERDSQRAFVQYQYDHTEIRGELGPPDSEEGYCFIGSYTSSDPNRVPQVRGIKIGDSAVSVIARFPNEARFPYIWNALRKNAYKEIYLYGLVGTSHYEGYIQFQKGRPIRIVYSCGLIIGFDLDADGNVAAISVSQEL